jgi:hypothetical protein
MSTLRFDREQSGHFVCRCETLDAKTHLETLRSFLWLPLSSPPSFTCHLSTSPQPLIRALYALRPAQHNEQEQALVAFV